MKFKIAKLKTAVSAEAFGEGRKNCNRGHTMLELLFYIAFFGLLSLAVINSMITMTRAFRETAIHAELLQSGNIMERISREVRQAYDITSISSGDLLLATTDDAGANKTVEILLSASNAQLRENGGLTGNLNTPTISVDALSFTQITTEEGKAVKITLTVRSLNDKQNRTGNFYNTVVLRGNYEE